MSAQCMRTSDVRGPVTWIVRGRTLGRCTVVIGEIQLTVATVSTG